MLYEVGVVLYWVYFLIIVLVLLLMLDCIGVLVEVVMVGCEGVVGLFLFDGNYMCSCVVV